MVDEVERSPVDLLVTYHPLLFQPVNRLVGGRSASARALRLLRNGTSLLVTHTDFDAAQGGTADSLAGVFGLRDVSPFGGDETEGLPDIGRVGSFEGSLAAVDAIATNELGVSGLRVSGDRKAQIDRLAVIPGSGSDFIAQAAASADALVTGDVAHHRAVMANDLGLAIVDPGHVATERPGMKSLVRLVEEIAGADVVDLTRFDPQTW